ncbi:glycosyltransferase family 2 protein [Desulfotignum balticum]|uniref:glycosyltransferase family 2 protein n=1 Tax=Desulfotignum balticum TaxID=115781 RepID=UPI000462C0D7|nr:glycosyltransferase family 2 protein [Desulfotignum balticum]
MLAVSIVTVSKNAEDVIEKTIQSVMRQSYPHIEFLIIDGRSTDSTMDIVKKYAQDISKAISEADNGIYEAMNKGIQLSTGDVLLFLNTGDYLHDSEVIRDAVQAFNENPSAGIIYGKPVFVNVPADLVNHSREYQTGDKTMMDWMMTPACHQCIFIRREVLESVGNYDTDYKLGGDVEFFLRCFKNKIQMHYIDRNISCYKYEGRSLTNLKLSNRERLKAIIHHASPLQLAVYSCRVLKRRLTRLLREKFRKNEPSC